jgi:hypothetical protein
VPVDEVGVAGSLALAQVLDGAELVVGDGLHVLDDLLDDHGLGVGVLNALVVDGLGRAV